MHHIKDKLEHLTENKQHFQYANIHFSTGQNSCGTEGSSPSHTTGGTNEGSLSCIQVCK